MRTQRRIHSDRASTSCKRPCGSKALPQRCAARGQVSSTPSGPDSLSFGASYQIDCERAAISNYACGLLLNCGARAPVRSGHITNANTTHRPRVWSGGPTPDDHAVQLLAHYLPHCSCREPYCTALPLSTLNIGTVCRHNHSSRRTRYSTVMHVQSNPHRSSG